MAEVNDVNSWNIFIDFIKVLLNWIGAIITALFMLIVGVTRNDFKKWIQEHNEMLLYFRDKTGASATKLRQKEEEEFNEIKKLLTDVIHDLKQVRQDNVNLKILINDLKNEK